MRYRYFLKLKRKIMRFAEKNQVVVKFRINDDIYANAYYRKTKRTKDTVWVYIKQPRTIKICVLLHELGHFLDYKQHPIRYKIYGQAYDSKSFYTERKLTKKQKKILVLAETRAWREGEKLAKELGIPLGNWFYKSREENLSTYRNCNKKIEKNR
jgi:hypothetical protein